MSELSHLVPSETRGFGKPAGRIPFAFGRRFFLLLLIGIVWLGPAWNDRRFLYAMALWDVAMLGVWLWDLRRLPRPTQLGVNRLWTTPPQLGVQSKVSLELQNSGSIPVTAQLIDDAPAAFRAGTPELEISVPPGTRTSIASYVIQPGQRGDAHFGDVYLRYQSALRIAERWAVVSLQQIVRVY